MIIFIGNLCDLRVRFQSFFLFVFLFLVIMTTPLAGNDLKQKQNQEGKKRGVWEKIQGSTNWLHGQNEWFYPSFPSSFLI